MAKKKEEVRDFLQIMSLDGSRLFGKKKLTAFKNGKLDRRLFSGVLDNSLDSMKLEEVFKKHKSEMPFPFVEESDCTRSIVSLSFKYTADQIYARRFIRKASILTVFITSATSVVRVRAETVDASLLQSLYMRI